MKSRANNSDIFDINKKTGAFILGKNRLDDYATMFLNKYCSETLQNPMPLPVDDIIKKMKLTVVEEQLSSNLDVFGCCLLLDSDIQVYDAKTNEYTEKFFKAGTIVIDPISAVMYGEGSKRNTLVHEMIHWEKDKAYFQILNVRNKGTVEKLYPIMCRQSEMYYQPSEGSRTRENEVRWLEWQAHRLTPRILMPCKTFKDKALELLDRESMSCNELVLKISDFFKVSKESTKYRLFEVGLEENLKTFDDFEIVFEDQLSKNEFVKLDPVEAFDLMEDSPELSAWIGNGKFVFIDGYFVIANKKYVELRNGIPSLTPYAKRNKKKCVINIRVKNVRNNVLKEDSKFALMKYEGVDERFYLFKPEDQTSLVKEPSVDELYEIFVDNLDKKKAEEYELEKMLANPDKSLCECLWYSFKEKGWDLPEQFNNETELHKNYHTKIKNNKYNNMGKGLIWTICVGLKYPVRIIQKVFMKTGYNIQENIDPDRTYINIIELMPGISLRDFNSILRKKNMKELGSEIRN